MSPRLPLPLRAYLLATARAERPVRALLARRAAAGKEDRARLDERLGRPSRERPEGPLIWLHAASVGESLSLIPLLHRLLPARPEVTALVTTGTVTSARLLADRLPDRALHQFAPVDTGAAVDGFLDHWKPDLAVWTESELWPRLILATAGRNIPMLLLNARMTARSVERWRLARKTAAAILSRFDMALAQDRATADALIELGLPEARVRMTGTLKQAAAAPGCDPDTLLELQRAIGPRPVWLAASTHDGEEALAAEAHRRVLQARPDTLLIVAPRHPTRAGDAATALQGLATARRTAGDAIGPDTQVYLADTLGEMGLWYRLAQAAFVGGSFGDVGGHNPFEPVSLGAAVIHGPDAANFADIYRQLDAEGAARRITSAETLAEAVLALQDTDARSRATAQARAVAEGGGDALDAAAEAVLTRLPMH